MGRLSAYAKHRILKLRFKKNKRIIHIVDILKKEDNIKVSRQAVSTFLKKYLETKSIYDKPRTGRKRKLTQEEVQLIGQVTRLNRDITARAIKEYLNLNVSTYTILRATKLFEWNKVNPNSNDSKKAAALERQMNGETAKRRSRSTSGKRGGSKKLRKVSLDNSLNESGAECVQAIESGELTDNQQQQQQAENDGTAAADLVNGGDGGELTASQVEELNNNLEAIQAIEAKLEENNSNNDVKAVNDSINEVLNDTQNSGVQADISSNSFAKKLDDTTTTTTQQQPITKHKLSAGPEIQKIDLNLIPAKELQSLKNISCSPMSFATKILFKIFKLEELHGHNVSGKTLNRNLKAKLPLDPIRVGYIKFLVESYYNEKECKEMLANANSHKQDLWKSCHTAINKSILISERKAEAAAAAVAAGGGNISTTTMSGNEAGNTSIGDAQMNESATQKSNGVSKSVNSKKANSCSKASNKSTAKSTPKHNGGKKSSSRLNAKRAAKRKRRTSSNSFNSSDEDNEYGTLHSEDISSNEDEARLESDSDDDDDEDDDKAMSKINAAIDKINSQKKPSQKISFRRSERQRKPAFKFNSSEFDTDSDSDFDLSSSDDDSEYGGANGNNNTNNSSNNNNNTNNTNNDDDEECPNEIELIQNIEKRLTNSNKTDKSAKATSNTNNKKTKQDDSHKTASSSAATGASAAGEPQEAESSEALAAANVAAAMKKLIVVVGDEKDKEKEVLVDDQLNESSNKTKSLPQRASRSAAIKTTTSSAPAVKSPAVASTTTPSRQTTRKSTTTTTPNQKTPSSAAAAAKSKNIPQDSPVERRLTRASASAANK